MEGYENMEGIERFEMEIDRLKAENERLREVLKAVSEQCEEAHTALEMIGPHDGIELMKKVREALSGGKG